jgi:hypothetical protein
MKESISKWKAEAKDFADLASPSGYKSTGWYELYNKKFADLVYTAGQKKEREEVLIAIDAIYDSEDPTPMYQEGYNHALDHIKQFIEGRQK